MEGTLAGIGAANFNVSDARLIGAAQSTSPSTGFSNTGASGRSYVTNSWGRGTPPSDAPSELNLNNYFEFAFSPISGGYEYDLHSISFWLRRSNNGPRNVQVVGTFGEEEINLGTLTYTEVDVFRQFSVPISKVNLSTASSIRFYGYGATGTQATGLGSGTLWFDEIIVRGTTTNFILPVRYTFTKAEALGESVQVAWQTASEQNSLEFVVQRSQDLHEWGDVGRVAAAGQSARLQTYTFMDPSPLLGVSYYRLRQIDQDGRYEYSASFEVIFRPYGQHIRALGNPVTDNAIRVKLFGVDPASLRLSTLTGQAGPFEAAQLGLDSWVLRPHHSLSSGLYLLHASQTHGLPLSVRVVVP